MAIEKSCTLDGRNLRSLSGEEWVKSTVPGLGEFPKMVLAVGIDQCVLMHAFISLLVSSDGMFMGALRCRNFHANACFPGSDSSICPFALADREEVVWKERLGLCAFSSSLPMTYDFPPRSADICQLCLCQVGYTCARHVHLRQGPSAHCHHCHGPC